MPALAVQAIAPAEVNCCVAPKARVAVGGEIVCGVPLTSVTTADAEPPGPVAVTVALLDEGMVAGAVYSPLALTVPAVALQLVAPAEVNC